MVDAPQTTPPLSEALTSLLSCSTWIFLFITRKLIFYLHQTWRKGWFPSEPSCFGRASQGHPFQQDRKSKVVSTPHKVKGKMYASFWGMFGSFLVLGSDKSVTVSRQGGNANLCPRHRRNYGITVGANCWQSSIPFDGKHCWIEHVTKQLPPALALERKEGTMDPLSKTRDTFNIEGSKDVLRKQKYHSSLCRLCLWPVSNNHSRGDWDPDKQDLGVEAQGRGKKGGNWIKPVMLHRMMLKIERCLKTA